MNYTFSTIRVAIYSLLKDKIQNYKYNAQNKFYDYLILVNISVV